MSLENASLRAGADVSLVVVRDARDDDIDAVQRIYAHHVLHGLASFEETPRQLCMRYFGPANAPSPLSPVRVGVTSHFHRLPDRGAVIDG